MSTGLNSHLNCLVPIPLGPHHCGSPIPIKYHIPYRAFASEHTRPHTSNPKGSSLHASHCPHSPLAYKHPDPPHTNRVSHHSMHPLTYKHPLTHVPLSLTNTPTRTRTLPTRTTRVSHHSMHQIVPSHPNLPSHIGITIPSLTNTPPFTYKHPNHTHIPPLTYKHALVYKLPDHI